MDDADETLAEALDKYGLHVDQAELARLLSRVCEHKEVLAHHFGARRRYSVDGNLLRKQSRRRRYIGKRSGYGDRRVLARSQRTEQQLISGVLNVLRLLGRTRRK